MGMDMGIISRNAANVVAAAAGLLILAVSARAADMTLRFSSAAPPSDFLAKSIELFKAKVEKANAGLKVDSYPASTLFKQGTEVPALQRGNLEMSTMTTFEVHSRFPSSASSTEAICFATMTTCATWLMDRLAPTTGVRLLTRWAS